MPGNDSEEDLALVLSEADGLAKGCLRYLNLVMAAHAANNPLWIVDGLVFGRTLLVSHMQLDFSRSRSRRLREGSRSATKLRVIANQR